MAMMELSIIPLGTARTSLSAHIAAIHKVLRKKRGFQVELNGMGTIVTGPASRLFQLAAELHKIPFSKDVRRVYTVLKVDDRRDKDSTPMEKVRSVLRKV